MSARFVTPGRIVHYYAKTRGYLVPAIVTATVESLDARGVELGHVPPLSSPDHVHLEVLTPGKLARYQEFNVPLASDEDVKSGLAWRLKGRWSWPELIPQSKPRV